MKQIIKKIRDNILIYVTIILILFSLIIDLIPNYFQSPKIKLFIYIFTIILAFIDLKIKNRRTDLEVEKNKNRKNFLIIVFVIYVILAITFLLFDGSYRRNTYNHLRLFSKEHFELYSNFIPFSTINEFIQRLEQNTINTDIVITNILGNLLAFAPFGVLIPLLFEEKFSKVWKFILLMIGIVFIIECIQFITLRGAFDVDDIILNVLGATITYMIMKLKWLRKVIDIILK